MDYRIKAVVSVAALLPCFMALADDPPVAKYGCGGCHQSDRKLVGPAWKDIAAKYADGSRSAADLAKSIHGGSSGRWGAIPMPPQTAVPEAEAPVLAAWVLNQK